MDNSKTPESMSIDQCLQNLMTEFRNLKEENQMLRMRLECYEAKEKSADEENTQRCTVKPIISYRLRHAFRVLDIKTPSDLALHPIREYALCHNIGRKSIAELKSLAAWYGIKIPGTRLFED